MLVADDAALVGDFDFDKGVLAQNNTLAAQAGVEARIDRAVDEVFLFVRNFLQIVLTAEYIYVASAASTYPATVVVEVDVVVLGEVKDGSIHLHVLDDQGLSNAFIFKRKLYGSHSSWFFAKKDAQGKRMGANVKEFAHFPPYTKQTS
jgi:hypothetical protein